VMIAAFVVLGLVVGHLLGGPDEGSRSALALSTSTRHPGVAMAVIAAVGAPAKEVLPAVLLYLVVGAIVSLPYMKWRRSREGAPAGPARRNA
jgi:BASS family bile acid:Na+ symporter